MYEDDHTEPVDCFLDYECGQQLQEHQKCCRQSGRNDRMSIKGIYDIHCHIVPGVDDGATDIGETVKLLRMEYEQGVRTVITTPHFRFRMFETPAEKVREQFRLVEKAASEISPDLHVYLGCEFHANMEMLPMLREQKVMTMAGSRYVLTEFSIIRKKAICRNVSVHCSPEDISRSWHI